MSDPHVSVVIPVFNVERYLRQAIESVLRQTESNWELILVDDGSTDGSEAICANVAERDARVQALHQTNAGAAAARNRGLSVARGDWILFLDSDDFYLRDDAMERLLNAAAKSDAQIVCFDSRRMRGDERASDANTPAGVPQLNVWEIVRENRYTSSPCLKMIRRALFEQHPLDFETGMVCEDVEWSLRLLLTGAPLVYLSEALYGYRIRSGSVTQTVSNKHVQDLLHAVEQCREDCLACGDEALRKLGLTYTAFQYCTLLVNLRLSKNRVERRVVRQIVALKHLLCYDAIPAVRLVRRTSRVLGVRVASWILTAYIRLVLNRKTS